MPNLRELLQSVSEHPSDYFYYYRMFEALVDAVEPGSTELAKAEIERLQAVRDYWYEHCLKAEGLVCAQHKDSDAEIGRLVRGMQDGTRLSKQHGTYWSCPYPESGTSWRSSAFTDPAEALRSIQEVGDAEA